MLDFLLHAVARSLRVSRKPLWHIAFWNSPSGIRTTSRGFRRVPTATDSCYFVRLFRRLAPN
jgi:hypothetical protein